MNTFVAQGSPTWDWLTAGGILGGFLLAALLVRLLFWRLLNPLVGPARPGMNEALLLSLRSLALWGFVLMGVYYAVSSLQAMQANARLVTLVGRAFSIAWVVFAVWTALRLFNGGLAWYVQSVRERPRGSRDLSHQAGLIRKSVSVLVLAIGLLYILRFAGVDISPLLTSGAIGGLAVALALQDTLANLFAGFFLAIDRPVQEGDFVRLESGEEGFVEEIGWRNTKVRVWANNVVVIPNATLSKSVITNYYLPAQDMSLYIPCGVAYDSDLEAVEAVTLETARAVLLRVKGADQAWEPAVRWQSFGDSAITFVTVLRVKDFSAQYTLQSEFIKALHRRFRDEGIQIPFPMRTVLLKHEGAGPGDPDPALDAFRHSLRSGPPQEPARGRDTD